MSLFRYLPLLLVTPLAATAQGVPALQTEPRPTPDADALADAMRRLGSNPRDLTALITAAELSLKLGDVTAAAALLKRADEIDPMNGRVKAGMARILVSQERPGEALRYFDQAAGYGLDPRTFAGDRGLAYDLIGESERAQRDYRTALKAGSQDEVQRRYALSLGISGKRDAALEQIDALLRKNDRGAWRARAFILAMTGDVAGAEKIATTMMPPGMAAGLQPFFARLPGLSATDRAFAVHFGEVRPTPQRLADRNLAPSLPALVAEPQAAPPVQVAVVAPPPDAKRDRRRERQARDRRRNDAERVASVAVSRAAVSQPATPALPPPPSYAGNGVAFAAPREVAQAVPRVIEPQRPARVAAAPTPSVPATVARLAADDARPGQIAADNNAPARVAAAVPIAPARQAAAPAASPARVSPAPGFSTIEPAPARVASAAPASAGPAATATQTAPARATAIVPTRMSEDTILARIMAGISIPASELGDAPLAPVAATSSPAATVRPAAGTAIATPASIAAAARAAEAARLAHQQRTEPRQTAATEAKSPMASAKARRRGTAATTDEAPVEVAAAEPTRSRRRGTKAPADDVPVEVAATETAGKRGRGRKASTEKQADTADDAPAVDPKVTARKTAAERKAAEAKKVAEAKRLAEKKAAAEEAKAAKADPPRIWVQVAGGARESDLPKAWAGVKGKAAALAGKSAYTTPLRATNRVVTGPFKTDAEARAFVNTLAKQGISAFPFTSEKGQKMKKLGEK